MPMIRLSIVRAALIAGIFPIASAWGFQMPSFHPLGPTRPPVRSTRPVNTPTPAKHASGAAKSMAKMTPETRKRIAEEMKRNKASRKTPPGKKIGR
jgi:hypothetical protein